MDAKPAFGNDRVEESGSPRDGIVLERKSDSGDEPQPEEGPGERGVTKRPPSSRQEKHLERARRAKSEKRVLMEKLYEEFMSPKPEPDPAPDPAPAQKPRKKVASLQLPPPSTPIDIPKTRKKLASPQLPPDEIEDPREVSRKPRIAKPRVTKPKDPLGAQFIFY